MGNNKKHLLGLVIWNKVNLLDWIADGIAESFKPEQVDLYFVLDHSTDGTREKLFELVKTKLKHFNTLGFFDFMMHDTYKFPCQNNAMMQAIKDGNEYQTLICPQDDQKITDPNLIANIEALLACPCHGGNPENVGIIGLRDGFTDLSYSDMVSSEWSESTLGKERLGNGAFVAKRLINDGGICYPISTIKKIGLNDVQSYIRFYIECDYAARCHAAGLTNYVMGNSLIHSKILEEGKHASTASDHYNDNKVGENDLKSFLTKWKS